MKCPRHTRRCTLKNDEADIHLESPFYFKDVVTEEQALYTAIQKREGASHSFSEKQQRMKLKNSVYFKAEIRTWSAWLLDD